MLPRSPAAEQLPSGRQPQVRELPEPCKPRAELTPAFAAHRHSPRPQRPNGDTPQDPRARPQGEYKMPLHWEHWFSPLYWGSSKKHARSHDNAATAREFLMWLQGKSPAEVWEWPGPTARLPSVSGAKPDQPRGHRHHRGQKTLSFTF